MKRAWYDVVVDAAETVASAFSSVVTSVPIVEQDEAI